MMEINEMNNSELRIKKTTIENEYESVKAKIVSLYNKLSELDHDYKEVVSEINKRKNYTN